MGRRHMLVLTLIARSILALSFLFSLSLSCSLHSFPDPVFLSRAVSSSLRSGNVGVDVGEVSLQGRRASTDPGPDVS